MLRINALRIFRRKYFHALRNNLTSEEAAEEAMDFVRAAFNEDQLNKGLSGIDREERWADVLEVLVEFKILLRDVPINTAAIPPKGQFEAPVDGLRAGEAAPGGAV